MTGKYGSWRLSKCLYWTLIMEFDPSDGIVEPSDGVVEPSDGIRGERWDCWAERCDYLASSSVFLRGHVTQSRPFECSKEKVSQNGPSHWNLAPALVPCMAPCYTAHHPVAAEGIFDGGGGANHFARDPESAGPPLGAEGPLLFWLA